MAPGPWVCRFCGKCPPGVRPLFSQWGPVKAGTSRHKATSERSLGGRPTDPDFLPPMGLCWAMGGPRLPTGRGHTHQIPGPQSRVLRSPAFMGMRLSRRLPWVRVHGSAVARAVSVSGLVHPTDTSEPALCRGP